MALNSENVDSLLCYLGRASPCALDFILLSRTCEGSEPDPIQAKLGNCYGNCYGAIYLGRPGNREGGFGKPDKSGQGGGL